MDDAQPMGFGQPLADLSGDEDSLPDRQRPHPLDRALQVLTWYELHGDVPGALLFSEIEHAADIPVRNLASELQLIPKPLYHRLVERDFLIQEFQGHLFFELSVENLVDSPHPSLSQFLDHLVSSRKTTPDRKFFHRETLGFGFWDGHSLSRL